MWQAKTSLTSSSGVTGAHRVPAQHCYTSHPSNRRTMRYTISQVRPHEAERQEGKPTLRMDRSPRINYYGDRRRLASDAKSRRLAPTHRVSSEVREKPGDPFGNYMVFTIVGVKKMSSSCFATFSVFCLKSHPRTGT